MCLYQFARAIATKYYRVDELNYRIHFCIVPAPKNPRYWQSQFLLRAMREEPAPGLSP